MILLNHGARSEAIINIFSPVNHQENNKDIGRIKQNATILDLNIKLHLKHCKSTALNLLKAIAIFIQHFVH